MDVTAAMLQMLLHNVADHWPFTPDEYPALEGMTEEEKTHFAIRHVKEHFEKAQGGLARIFEHWDHGIVAETDFDLLEGLCLKLFRDSLRLAELLKIIPERMIEYTKQ